MPSDKTTVATTADFAPTVVGHTDSHRARVASAHDETREEPGPGLHQEAQIVLGYGPSTDPAPPTSGSRRSLSVRQSVTLQVPGP